MADLQRTQLAANTTSLAAQAPASFLRLVGVTFIETAGAVALVSIQEGTGTDLTKEILAQSLAANQALTVWLPEHGVPCEGGIWVNRVSGTTRLVVHYRVSDKGKDSSSAPNY
jgi:hypothetical protein